MFLILHYIISAGKNATVTEINSEEYLNGSAAKVLPFEAPNRETESEILFEFPLVKWTDLW